MNDTIGYGLISQGHLNDMAKRVCEALGHGQNYKAYNLLIETAGAETARGIVLDNTIHAGMGITQIDKIPFQDIKDRCRESDKTAVRIFFGIDIDLVEWEHLRYNPLLALIFTRLKYKKIPQVIPNDIEQRAKYWKHFYNTEEGKGTVDHYLSNNFVFNDDEIRIL